MKGIKPIVIPRKIAREKWKEYIEASKVHGDAYIKELRGLYFHLKEDRKVIDIFEAFKFTGLNENNEPKLAIAKADSRYITFVKQTGKKGYFSEYRNKDNVLLPEGTFNIEFPKHPTDRWSLINERIRTRVPIVPANKMPKKGKLGDYYIIWEVDKWENVPKDPFLLKRISNNLFVIISSWQLTRLERALINGR
jgi:hypothetical protein